MLFLPIVIPPAWTSHSISDKALPGLKLLLPNIYLSLLLLYMLYVYMYCEENKNNNYCNIE